MLLTALPMFLASSSGFPAVTVGVAYIGVMGMYGYVRPGGVMSGALSGLSGGTLSGTLVPGYVTDAVFSASGSVGIYVIGDCTALLTDVTALKINSTICAISTPAAYSVYDATTIEFDGSAIHMAASTSYTVQLV